MTNRTTLRMAYVILHYNCIDETRKCIRSIQNTEAFSESIIVVVDNASPNGTGKVLAEEYASESGIKVILNRENAGFSRGNNLGYRYVRENYDADFVTICNNDVVFPSADYVALVEKAYAEKPFEVLGPDILQTTLNIHQSPLGQSAPDEETVSRTIRLNQLAKRFFPLFWLVFGRGEIKKLNSRTGSIGWDVPAQDVPLMGACLVFSRSYIEQREKAFEPETFLYYEEYLLWLYCKRHHCTMVYRPEIRVLHNEGVATSSESRSARERYRKGVHNILDAATIYLEELRKG